MARFKTKEIKFRVIWPVYELLQDEAAEAGIKSVNKYCKEKVQKQKRDRKVQKNFANNEILLRCADDISSMRESFNQLIMEAIEDKIIFADEIKCMEKILFEIELAQAEMLNYVRTHGNNRERESDGNTDLQLDIHNA